MSIGDGVITSDDRGRVTLLNPVAEKLTGWRRFDAEGQPVEKIFHIVNEETRALVESPVAKVLRDGAIVGLANHTVLIGKEGKEVPSTIVARRFAIFEITCWVSCWCSAMSADAARRKSRSISGTAFFRKPDSESRFWSMTVKRSSK